MYMCVRVMYMYVGGINFASVSTIFVLDFGTGSKRVFFFVFHYIVNYAILHLHLTHLDLAFCQGEMI
jgi:hypothetical protein